MRWDNGAVEFGATQGVIVRRPFTMSKETVSDKNVFVSLKNKSFKKDGTSGVRRTTAASV